MVALPLRRRFGAEDAQAVVETCVKVTALHVAYDGTLRGRRVARSP